MTLVLFRTRRRDECARLKESVRRRVRKSRQKEAVGAADAGLMQIEWGEGGCRSSLEWSRRVEKEGVYCAKTSRWRKWISLTFRRVSSVRRAPVPYRVIKMVR